MHKETEKEREKRTNTEKNKKKMTMTSCFVGLRTVFVCFLFMYFIMKIARNNLSLLFCISNMNSLSYTVVQISLTEM